MAKTKKPVLTETVIATGTVVKNRLVAYTGKQAKAGEAAIGVAVYDADAGDSLAVDALGVVLAETGGTVAAGDALAADAQGCVIKHSSTGVIVGRAIDAATGANETIRIKIGG